jgi:hypothetical protein
MARDRSITLFVRIHDYVTIKNSGDRKRYAFRANKQRLVDGTLTGGLWGDVIKPYYHALNARLVKELKAAQVMYYIVPMNEADYLADPGDTEALKNQKVADFHQWYKDDLISLGVSPHWLIASVSRAEDAVQAQGYLMEGHGVNSPERMANLVGQRPNWLPNGDGPDPYALGAASFNGNKMPSVTQAALMLAYAKEHGIKFYMYPNRPIEATRDTDVRRADFAALRILTEVDK